MTNNWTPFLNEEFEKPYFKQLSSFLNQEYKTKTIYPPKKDVFNAFYLTDLNDVKVVILGQDPYHGPHQACGLCFAVRKEVALPPSLHNIYLELKNDLNIEPSTSGYLVPWARQGVFLLNTILTVEANKPLSHKDMGWEIFTDTVIRKLDSLSQPIVFLLWGSKARKKKELLSNPNHLILEAAHPSPLSAYQGFFGCKHFSLTNEYLIKHGLEPIDWRIENV